MNKKRNLITVIGIILAIILALWIIGIIPPKINREKYENKEVTFTVTNHVSEVKQVTILTNANNLKEMLDSYDYKDEVCEGIANYTLECNDGTKYDILVDCNGITKDGKEATIPEDEMKQIENYINEN